MSITRQFLFSTLIFALVPPAIVHGAPPASIEYVGGTVKSIPANTTGSFSFDDRQELYFNYGSSAYKLPYIQITSTDLSKPEMHHILRKIPMPSLNPGKQIETLTIAYKDASGARQSLNFQMTARQAWSVRDSIAEKKAEMEAFLAGQSNNWWGDSVWKTNRNQGSWDANAQSLQSLQSVASGTH